MARPGATPSSLLAEIVTDMDWRIPALRLVEAKASGGGRPAWHYFNTWTSGAAGTMPLLFDLGADGSDAVYDTYSDPYDAGRALVSQVMPAFGALARSGDPNHDNMPHWPAYSPNSRDTMIFDFNSRVENDPFSSQRKAWDGIR